MSDESRSDMTQYLRVCAFLALMLTSCSTPNQPIASNAHLAVSYDPNPAAGAIVGMWTNSYTSRDGARLVTSQFFKSDGTGMNRNSSDKEINFPFTWKYDGGGWWTQFPDLDRSQSNRFRVSPPSPVDGSRTLFNVFRTDSPGMDPIRYRRVK